jgi:CRISPR-associated endonuclease Csy4
VDHYIDIKLLPDPEFVPSLLMNALHAKLHRALVLLASSDIGLSFPDYGTDRLRLGDRMRLHGTQQRLKELMDIDWLKGMRDHIRTSDISSIPESARPIAVRRIQVKSNAERIRRRQIQKHGYSAEEALQRVPDSIEKRLKLPFLTLKSKSSDQVFRLFIQQGQADALVQGNFNAYGLSGDATLPHF